MSVFVEKNNNHNKTNEKPNPIVLKNMKYLLRILSFMMYEAVTLLATSLPFGFEVY